MADLLGYFLTWTTYGSWLPGDERGWVHHRAGGILPPDSERSRTARRQMKGQPVRLNSDQRRIVRDSIIQSFREKGWDIYALNVRSNHVHIVVAVPNKSLERVISYLKAWASRNLNEAPSIEAPRRWWTRHGSTRYIKIVSSLEKAVEYVTHHQENRSRLAR